MSALPKRYFTPEEYLLLEERSPYKSQYIHGEIFPMGEDTDPASMMGGSALYAPSFYGHTPPSLMGGAAPDHVLIASNLNLTLGLQFRGRPCRVFNADLRVAVAPGEIYTYPDVVALCGEPQYEPDRRPASLLNPQMIVEVLSPSTQSFDRGDKFLYYQQLASLTDYLLVSVERMHVEHRFRRLDVGWQATEYRQPADRVPLASVNAELLLADIYERIMFSV